MTPEQKQYDETLDSICESINQLKTTHNALTMAQEVQRHLNRVIADLKEEQSYRWF